MKGNPNLKKKTNADRAVMGAKDAKLVRLPDRMAIAEHEVRPEQPYIFEKRHFRGGGRVPSRSSTRLPRMKLRQVSIALAALSIGSVGGFGRRRYGYREDVV